MPFLHVLLILNFLIKDQLLVEGGFFLSLCFNLQLVYDM